MLILNGTLVIRSAEGYTLARQGLRIENTLIAGIGPDAELTSKYPRDEVLDAQGLLVMPGLICAHCHPSAIFARGMMLPGSIAVGEPLRALWRALISALGYEDIRYSMLAYAVEAIRGGVTTLFVHHSSPNALDYALDSLAEAALQAGLRACLSYEVSDRYSAVNGRKAVEENVRLARRIKNETLLAAMMGLDASMHLSDETLAAAVGAAAIADIGLHIHVAEDQADEQDSLKRFNMRVVERLRKRGVLGRRTIAVHCVNIMPSEMDLLAKANSWVVYCPRSNLNDAGELAPVPVMLEHGLSVGLGVDGFRADMFCEMQVGTLLIKHRAGYPHASSPLTVARMVLDTNAALASRIFHVKLGELSVGAQADIILVDYLSPTPLTAANLPWHLMNMQAGHVDTTIVAGRVLMRQRRLMTMDEKAVWARAHQAATRLWARL